ncbi:MAG TPA: hypothetical protein PKZ16_03000 [bacterium]|nr:hypothetical protein [bacterium]HPL95163.1 hypothetical protein [bacterium]
MKTKRICYRGINGTARDGYYVAVLFSNFSLPRREESQWTKIDKMWRIGNKYQLILCNQIFPKGWWVFVGTAKKHRECRKWINKTFWNNRHNRWLLFKRGKCWIAVLAIHAKALRIGQK